MRPKVSDIVFGVIMLVVFGTTTWAVLVGLSQFTTPLFLDGLLDLLHSLGRLAVFGLVLLAAYAVVQLFIRR